MEQELDRNDAATPYKLEQARKKGQVFKSADVVSALVFAAAVVYFYARGWDAVSAQFHSCRTFGKPRKRNCRRPNTFFKTPKVVSAIRGRSL